MHTPASSKTDKKDKKAVKRRNRNKRRRKLRQQRKNQANGVQSRPMPRKRAEQKPKAKKSPEEISKSWEALCLETYQRLTTWQSEAELNFWKARTEWLQNENKDLKEQLDTMCAKNSLKVEKETVDDVLKDEETDAAYLEFITVTKKHREELRKHREKQSQAKGAD